METVQHSITVPRRGLWPALLWGGAIAGALDLACAFVIHGSPLQVSQSIASGLLGSGAYQGGVASAALGVGLHFGIIFAAALVFCLLARRRPLLLRQPLIAGIVYGAVVYLAMHFIVLPLSRVPFELNYNAATVARDLLIHCLLVGLPIAFAARRFLLGQK